MKLLYLILKEENDKGINFESVLPIVSTSQGRVWNLNIFENLKALVFATQVLDEVQIFAVMIEDEEADRILREAQLGRETNFSLDSGTIDPGRMCQLARITCMSGKMVLIESNSNLHSLYQNFFESHRESYDLKEACFKPLDLDHQTKPMGQIEEKLIKIVEQCSLETFFYLEATHTTKISLKDMLTDFIQLGKFRQSTKVLLKLIFLALKCPLEFYRTPQEDFMREHVFSVLQRHFDGNPAMVFSGLPISDEWLTEGYYGSHSPIYELMKASKKVSKDEVRIVLSECYPYFKNFSESLLECLSRIVNIAHSPDEFAKAETLYGGILEAHLEVNYRFDEEKTYREDGLIFGRGTQVFPVSDQLKNKKSVTSEGSSPNCRLNC